MEKSRVVRVFLATVQSKMEELQAQLDGLAESKGSEQKSSAGDKFETSREMMRQEEELLTRQLRQLEQQRSGLAQAERTCSQAAHGAFVQTSLGNFLLVGALGSEVIDGVKVMAVSMGSPLGAALSGRSAGDSFTLNGQPHMIESIA
jgi:transcription elongation GreA/GreB family factor